MTPFLAWGDFHARSRFACSTIPEEKWGTTRSLLSLRKNGGQLVVYRLLYTSNSWHYSCPRSVCCQSIVSYVSEYLNPQLFLCGFGFRSYVSGESGIRIRTFLNPLSRVEIFECAMNPESCVDAKSRIFLIRWHNEIELFLNREYLSTMLSLLYFLDFFQAL